jgi:hypothetical protein
MRNKPMRNSEASTAIPARLGFTVGSAPTVFRLSETERCELSARRFLCFEAVNEQPWVSRMFLHFYVAGDTEPRLSFRFHLMPRIPTTVSFPLEALSSRWRCVWRTPLRLQGFVSGLPTRSSDVDRLGFSIELLWGRGEESIDLRKLWFADREPDYSVPNEPLVDRLGQRRRGMWPGKTSDEAELRTRLQRECGADAATGVPRHDGPRRGSVYNGYGKPIVEASGFFSTAHDGKRWWLIDPDGRRFFSTGVCGIRPEQYAWTTGISSLFEELPSAGGDFRQFRRDMSEAEVMERFAGQPWQETPLAFDFAGANLYRAFGTSWRRKWSQLTASRMRRWGFNTAANRTPPDTARDMEMPYVYTLVGYPSTKARVFRDFPDVFDPAYRTSAERFARQLSQFVDDRLLIGYFMRNEPEWAFVRGANLGLELLQSPESLKSRDALVAGLSDRYAGDVSKLNAAWGSDYARFADLLRPHVPAALVGEDRAPDRAEGTRARESAGNGKNAHPRERVLSDLLDFSRQMIEEYIRIPAEECRRQDPNHLNLGMRYAFVHSPSLFAGSRNFDAFSINCYKTNPVERIEHAFAGSGLPVIVGEFHFGALDRGLVSPGLKPVQSQRARGTAYAEYLRAAARHPACVGAHYFPLNDQPYLGRFDGENYQIGLVDVCNRPYESMLRKAARANRRIYRTASRARRLRS